MAKNEGFGQAAILSNSDYAKLYKVIDNKAHALILSILRYTGERIGAVCQLQVSDVYSNPWTAEARSTILFKGMTRKQAAGLAAPTHEVPVCEHLKRELERFIPPMTAYLFTAPSDHARSLSPNTYDKAFRRYLKKAGLDRRGISLHSPRRTLITTLHEKGVPPKTIQAISGHKTLNSLQRYIDTDDRSKKAALELL